MRLVADDTGSTGERFRTHTNFEARGNRVTLRRLGSVLVCVFLKEEK